MGVQEAFCRSEKCVSPKRRCHFRDEASYAKQECHALKETRSPPTATKNELSLEFRPPEGELRVKKCVPLLDSKGQFRKRGRFV